MKAKTLFITIIIYSLSLFILYIIRFSVKEKEPVYISMSFAEMGKELEQEGRKGGEGIEKRRGSIPLPLPSPRPSHGEPERPLPPLPGEKIKEREKRYTISGPLSRRRVVKLVLPEYPEGEKGSSMVKIKIGVDKNGNVVKMEVVKTGGALFDKNAMDAIRSWKFESSPKDEIVYGMVTIFFRMK